MLAEPSLPPGGFDTHQDRDPETCVGEVAWGEWVYSHDRAVRACLTRSTHDEGYLLTEANPDELGGLYGTTSEPMVMVWIEVASGNAQASEYALMSPQEHDDYASYMLGDEDHDEVDDAGDKGHGSDDASIDAEWTPPDWVPMDGDEPDHISRLTLDEVDGAHRYRLLAHLVWRISAETAKGADFDKKELFADVPWMVFTPDPWNEPMTLHIIHRPGEDPVSYWQSSIPGDVQY